MNTAERTVLLVKKREKDMKEEGGPGSVTYCRKENKKEEKREKRWKKTREKEKENQKKKHEQKKNFLFFFSFLVGVCVGVFSSTSAALCSKG